MNDFLSVLTRWTVRAVLLVFGVVFFLSLLAAACVLAAVWGLRALWAKLTGRSITPWVMPMQGASSWSSMYQRAGNFGAKPNAAAPEQDNAPPPFTPAEGSKRSGVLAQTVRDVSDVQPREVRDV